MKPNLETLKRLATPRMASLLSVLIPGFKATHIRDNGSFRANCPVHGGDGLNLGYSANSGGFTCYSHCGGMSLFQLVSRALGIPMPEAVTMISKELGIQPTEKLPEYVPAPTRLVYLDERELKDFEGQHVYWQRIPDWVRLHMEGGYCQQKRHQLYGRITFPVRDEEGRLVGITARCAGKDPPDDATVWTKETWYKEWLEDGVRHHSGMKYRHWGANTIRNGRPVGGFSKSLVLLHYHIAKKSTGLPMLVVEGPFDICKAVEYGWQAVVGIMGDLPSAKQWELLAKHKCLIYGLDVDSYLPREMRRSRYELFCDQAKQRDHKLLTFSLPSGIKDIGEISQQAFRLELARLLYTRYI